MRVLLTALLVAACSIERTAPTGSTERARADVAAFMDSIPARLHAAGPIGWLDLFDAEGGFRMATDGVLLFPSHDSATTFLEAFGPTTREMAIAWDSVRVELLAPGVALAETGYRESITDTAGTVSRFGGHVSMLLRRGSSGWRIRHLHWSSPAAGGTTSTTESGASMGQVTGIGGLFFRARDPKALATWYEDQFGISRVPESYGEGAWWQDEGPTVFAPFSQDTKYFGRPEQAWMLNLRVRDMDAMVAQLQARGIEVEVDPEQYPNGRFALTHDPEGNPIQLWEPQGEATLTRPPRP